jgi:hypothetical protein
VAPGREEKVSRIRLEASIAGSEVAATRDEAAVDARLRTTTRGSTGVDVSITLEDPADMEHVRAAIDEHFGGADEVDVLRIR